MGDQPKNSPGIRGVPSGVGGTPIFSRRALLGALIGSASTVFLGLDYANSRSGFLDGPLTAAAELLLPGTFTNHGGTIQHNPKVQLVLWGTGWNLDPEQKATADLAVSCLQYLNRSPYLSVLRQYGDSAGAFEGTLALEHVIAVTSDEVYLTKEYVATNLTSLARSNHIRNDADTQWVVLLGSDVTFPVGGVAEHGLLSPGQGANFVFSVVPWHGLFIPPDDRRTIAGSSLVAQSTVGAMVHEVLECITDPRLDGWYAAMPTAFPGGPKAPKAELMDIAHDAQYRVHRGRFFLPQIYDKEHDSFWDGTKLTPRDSAPATPGSGQIAGKSGRQGQSSRTL